MIAQFRLNPRTKAESFQSVSQLLIQNYLNQLQDPRRVSGTGRESVVREAFKDLLKGWGRSHDLIFIPEYEHTTPDKRTRYVDGALLHALRIPFGYWEAKGKKDRRRRIDWFGCCL